jgi:hypothetical protein
MITYWKSIRQPQGQRLRVTWERLFKRFESPLVAEDKLTLPGWAPATFRDDRRALANVEQVVAVGLDLDDTSSRFAAGVELWQDYAVNVHTTHSSTPDAPRYRVVLPTSRPMTPAEYIRVRRWCARRSDEGGQPTDPRVGDPSRLWFVPGAPPRRVGEYRCVTIWGAPLDVDEVLRFEPEAPPPPPPPPALPATPAEVDVVDRARAYLARIEPAISGSYGGTHTLIVATKMVKGFGLDQRTAFGLLWEWNKTCQPPWSEKDLRRKVAEAARVGLMKPGAIRDRPRRAG